MLGLLCIVSSSTFLRAQTTAPWAPARISIDFDTDWRFKKADFASAALPEFDDTSWRQLNVPHDWSIEGPFAPDQGSGNGYAPGGIGWYRKHFSLDPDGARQSRRDRVRRRLRLLRSLSQRVLRRREALRFFQLPMRSHAVMCKFGGENVIAVRVDHSHFADSRFYTGSGIYRHVRLRVTDPLRIGDRWRLRHHAAVTDAAATSIIETTLLNLSAPKPVDVFPKLRDSSTAAGTSHRADHNRRRIPRAASWVVGSASPSIIPQLWSLESPTLYTLKTSLSRMREPADDLATSFGIRTIRFDPDQGFFLNGKNLKLKGVCIHHDAGCAGRRRAGDGS